MVKGERLNVWLDFEGKEIVCLVERAGMVWLTRRS